jgi:hypothetical protein
MTRLENIIQEHLDGLNSGKIKVTTNNYCVSNVDHMIQFVKVNQTWVHPSYVEIKCAQIGIDFIKNKTNVVFTTTQNSERFIISIFQVDNENIFSLRPALKLCQRLGLPFKTFLLCYR